jgi:putative DNA primase/helicase
VQDNNEMPAVAPPDWDNIPASLAERQQWLLWKFERKEGQAKPGKIPYYVIGGRRTGDQGSDRDRARLATLPVVRKAFERGGWSGVGFAFLPGDGLIGIDVDGAVDVETGEVSERLQRIIQACNSFTEYSPSGKGAHIIVLGHTTTNKSNDIGLEVFCERQFFTVTGRRWPDTPPNVEAISEGALKRLHATIDEAKGRRQEQRGQASPPPAPAGFPPESEAQLRARVEHALTFISPDLGYNDWISVGWAIRSAFGEFGFGLWDSWSSRGSKYSSSADLQSHWRSFTADKTPDEAVAVIFKRAKEAGWKPLPKPGRNAARPPAREKAAPAGGAESAGSGDGGGSGGPPADDSPWDPEDEEGGAVQAALVRRGKRPADCRENVLYCMRLDPLLVELVRMNDFTDLLERSRATPWGREPGEWDEEDDLMLGEYLLREYNLMIKATGTLRAGVRMASRLWRYNPVVDLVRSQPWDGIERLPHWISDCLGVEESAYTRLIGTCFIMGMVARALTPGCKFDYMLILKGAQGAQKSTVFRTLAAPWFTDNAIRMGDKDSLLAMQAVWLAESSELESLNKSETNAIKQFLSASEDLFRPPYGAQMVKRPRHAVFGGTTNADVFLKDVTGDRRFWPLEVGEINIETLKAQRLQLFAEALVRLLSDDPDRRRTYPTRQEEKELVFPEQERFKMTDVWEDILYDYVNRKTPDKNDDPGLPARASRDFFSTRELFEHALQIKADRIDGNKNMETRIGNCMRAIGFQKYRESKGERRRGYMRLKADPSTPAPDTPTAAPSAPPVGGPGSNPWEDDDLPI